MDHPGMYSVEISSLSTCFGSVCIIFWLARLTQIFFSFLFSAVIMFIVRTDEVNVYVQRILEYHIKNKLAK